MHAATDLRDLYRPRGGVSRLTLRRLLVLVRALPNDTATATALGGSGFSVDQLLTMDLWLSQTGDLHPLHPAQQVKDQAQQSKARKLAERQAYYQQAKGIARD